MDGDERAEARELATREPHDDGYRAGGRLRDGQSRRTRAVVIAIVAVIGISVVLSALTNNANGLAPMFGDLGRTFVAQGTPYEVVPTPTTVPRVGILDFPLPERPVPMQAGWLRWLDPRTGAFQGDAMPTNGADPTLTFADAQGAVVQVCGASQPPGDDIALELDICAFNADGGLRRRLTLTTVHADPLPAADSLAISSPIQLDATVSRDGRWLWLARSVHIAGAWHVAVDRVDVAHLAAAGSREIRIIPIAQSGLNIPSPEGWLVADSATVRPVIRTSPDGSRLSVTITEVPDPDASVGLLRQERVAFDSSLKPTRPIDVVFPVGGASDLACDESRAAWATDTHYLTLCSHPEPNGDIQPFVRIESPNDMTRDVAVGPLILEEDRTFDDSSWLLDARRGVLYRWSYLHRTLSVLDVTTRAGTTVTTDPRRLQVAGPDWPAPDPGDGLLAWSGLEGGDIASRAAPRLAGSADGTVLYALGRVPLGRDGVVRLGSIVWAIDARSARVLGRWIAPGPVDQLALAPGGGPLVELVTPIGRPGRGAFIDWTTELWFVDARTGAPLEVLGEIRGPGYSSPTLLPPAVMTFAGS